jgi:hypothetical protein
MLHVVQISFFLDPQRRSPEQIIRDWWQLVVGAEMVARNGARVTVVQACGVDYRMTRNRVSYMFTAPDDGQGRISTSLRFGQLIQTLDADIFHVHGLGFYRDVVRLAELAPTVPIFLQDHADRVPKLWRRRAMRRGLAAAADLFVSGSQREGSGTALLESLACGLPPIVTDIPSFRMLTCDGRIGALWSWPAHWSDSWATMDQGRPPPRI